MAVLEKPLQIVNGGFAVLSPDADKLAFTPVDREFRTWKRYKGGRATDIWVYDLVNNTSEQITTFAGSDQWPVWWKDDIYFTSDRDLRLNIYRYNTQTRETTQLTSHREFDVMWPSGRNGKIVYENGGYLYVLDLATATTGKITVSLRYDNPFLATYFKNVKDDVHSFAISPNGKRALFDARGDIYSVPAENGMTVNLTETPRAFAKYIRPGRPMADTSRTTPTLPASTNFIFSKTKKTHSPGSSLSTLRPGNMSLNGRPTAATWLIVIAP
jgi:tricorn protease